MKRRFAGAGAWPTPKEKAVTNADILALQRDCPSVFKAELEATDLFVNCILPLAQDMNPEFKITPEMTALDVRVAAFRTFQDFGRELEEAMKAPVGEVRDE